MVPIVIAILRARLQESTPLVDLFLTGWVRTGYRVSPRRGLHVREHGRNGFTENPDVPAALARIREPGMSIWREKLFALLSRNARTATSFFHLPPNRVAELGAQIEL